MSKFSKWITGAAKREKKWQETPRAIPDEYKDIPPGDDRFVIGPSYINPDVKSQRRYYAAVFCPDRQDWELNMYIQNMDVHDKSLSCHPQYKSFGPEAFLWDEEDDNPELIRLYSAISVAEKLAKGYSVRSYYDGSNEYWKKEPGSDGALKIFARRHGIQFRESGYPYQVTGTQAQTEKTFLKGKALQNAFSTVVEEPKRPFENWEAFRGKIAIKPVLLEASDWQKEKFVFDMQDFMRQANNLHHMMSISHDHGQQQVDSFIRAEPVGYPDHYSRCTQQDCAQMHAMDSVKLWTLACAGAKFYASGREKGISKGRDDFAKVGVISKAISKIAYKCSLNEKQVESVKNLMTSGPDQNAIHPLREFIQLHLGDAQAKINAPGYELPPEPKPPSQKRSFGGEFSMM